MSEMVSATRQRGLTLPASDPELVFVYETTNSSGRSGLVAERCLASPWGDCGALNWSTDPNANSFMPALGVEFIPLPPPDPYYTFDTWLSVPWDGQRTFGWVGGYEPGQPGRIGYRVFRSRSGWIGHGISVHERELYWGDYDESVFVGNDTSNPTLIRPFTDSTDSVCDGNGNPMHILVRWLSADCVEGRDRTKKRLSPWFDGSAGAVAAGWRDLLCACSECDRGQMYCGTPCRKISRAEIARRARAVHQASPLGRQDHRDRNRDYRARRSTRVMDLGSKDLALEVEVIGTDAAAQREAVPDVGSRSRLDELIGHDDRLRNPARRGY